MSTCDLTTSTETWKSIPDFPGYFVSDHGRVESRKWHERRILKGSRQKYGHLSVSLWQRNKESRRIVHRLVLEAFVGPCPEGMQCRHLDGDATNNHVSNLRWGTPQENADDRIRHGTSQPGSRNHCAKLTEVDVIEIRRAYADGTTQRELAGRFGVFEGNIEKICRRVIWRHV